MAWSAMTQTLLTIFLPTLLVLVGVLLNRCDTSRLDAGLPFLETRPDGSIGQFEARLYSRLQLVLGRLSE